MEQTGVWKLGGLEIRYNRILLIQGLVLYLIGTAWFMIQTGRNITESLSMCVLPFLPGDAVKMALSSFLAPRLRKAMKA